MITTAQKDLLESYFGQDGIYEDAILESKIHSDIMMDFLDQALTQSDVIKFNLRLDILYRYIFKHDRISTIENALLRSLKLINNLVFNHSSRVQTDAKDFELPTRQFFLGKLSEVDTSNAEFAVQLHTILSEYIAKIKIKLRSKISGAQDVALPSEGSIYWRRELNLPQSQQLLYSQVLEILIAEKHISKYDLINLGTQWAENVAQWFMHSEVQPLWDHDFSILRILKCSTDVQIRMVLDICKESAIKKQLDEKKITFEDVFRLGLKMISDSGLQMAQAEEQVKKPVILARSSIVACARNSAESSTLSLPQINVGGRASHRIL